MAYGSIPLDKRLKDNIRNYKLSSLIDMEGLQGLRSWLLRDMVRR